MVFSHRNIYYTSTVMFSAHPIYITMNIIMFNIAYGHRLKDFFKINSKQYTYYILLLHWETARRMNV